MEYKFLEELTDKELEELKSVLLEENKRKEFMMKIEKIKNRKIENRDYGDYQKLLYLPQGKSL